MSVSSDSKPATPIPAGREPFAVDVESGRKYLWCSCGRSATQPFCDGSHKGTGLKPVLYVARENETVYLCACKSTGTQPLCDGSHNTLT